MHLESPAHKRRCGRIPGEPFRMPKSATTPMSSSTGRWRTEALTTCPKSTDTLRLFRIIQHEVLQYRSLPRGGETSEAIRIRDSVDCSFARYRRSDEPERRYCPCG